MLAKSPHILVELPTYCTSGWVAMPTFDIHVLGTVREPFTADELQREHQADHHDFLRDHELRIGQRRA